MGWLTRFVGSVSGTRRLVRMWLSRVSFLINRFAGAGADTRVVESVPIASHPILQVSGLTKPATWPKWVPARGQGGSHPMTHLHAHKVTCVISPLPEATIEAPPVA